MNKSVKELTVEDPSVLCLFCHISGINSLEWGPMYQLEGVAVHYFCMLFSAGLSQNGEDDEGILGFLPQDIRKETRRGDKLKCKFCKKNNATIGCSIPSCRTSYHYPCGLKAGCDFHFIGNFESYCLKHKTEVDIPLDAATEWDCPICFTEVPSEEIPLWPPCCKKRVFHKKCIMQMAKNAGKHFFKCPLCNDKDIFSVAMRKSGVYLPDRDAAWETEPNAFADHTRLHNRCDATICQCPQGREHSSKSESKPWKVIRCGGCGAFAIHKFCGKLKNLTWRCPTCEVILSDKRKSELLNSSRIQRHRYDTSEDEEDSDTPVISVRDAVLGSSRPTSRTSSSSSSSSSDFCEVNVEKRTKQIFDPRYGRNFVVESEEESGTTEDELDENQEDEVFVSPSSSNVHAYGSLSAKTSASASISRSSEEVIHPDNGSDPAGASSLGNTPPTPSFVSFPSLGRDKLIKNDSRKFVKGRIELQSATEIVSELNCRIVKISTKGISEQSCSSSAPFSKRLDTAMPSNVESSSDDKTEALTKTENFPGAAPECLEAEKNPNLTMSDDLSVVHVGKPETDPLPVVELDEESSDSDLEVLSENVSSSAAPSHLSTVAVDLANNDHKGVKYKRPRPVVRLGLDDHHIDQIEFEYPARDNENIMKGTKRALTFSSFSNVISIPLSTAFLRMIQRGQQQGRNPTHFSGRIANSKNQKSDLDIIDLDDSDDDVSSTSAPDKTTSARENRKGEGASGKSKRERLRQCSSSESGLSKDSSYSSSKRARK